MRKTLQKERNLKKKQKKQQENFWRAILRGYRRVSEYTGTTRFFFLPSFHSEAFYRIDFSPKQNGIPRLENCWTDRTIPIIPRKIAASYESFRATRCFMRLLYD